MTRRKRPTVPTRSTAPAKDAGKATRRAAFNVWLQRGLHQLFDPVTTEPIPEQLLRLIEEDRKK
jgi:hypothetical protein